MKSSKIYLLSIILLLAAVLLSSCSHKESHEEHSEHSAKTVDVKAVDKNGDGKVHMCPMFCTDLVSDEPGNCPQCEMKLEEYSIADAEKHMKDKGYKIEGHDMHDAEHNKVKGSAAEFDANKDGKVYQCPMMCEGHTSDEPGRCAACEMKLKEYSIEDADKNLMKKSS